MDTLEQNPILIELPAEVFDDWIAKEYPHIQRKLREQPEHPIIIDFELCEFLSPLPVLALATEVMTYSLPGREILINLGAGGTGIPAENKARTRKFLSLHGFINAFMTREDLSVRVQFDLNAETGQQGIWFAGFAGAQMLRPLLERASTELAYGEVVVLPATTWRLPVADKRTLSADIRTQVGILLHQADASLFRFKTEARKYRDTTLQRITQVLLELVENSAEHAYIDTTGYVGLYARVRSPRGTVASALRAKEISRSILLDRILLSEHQHQIEVFVVDVGRGLFADMEKWTGVKHASLRRTPLRRTSQYLFSHPFSRHNRNDSLVKELRGSSTGLMHLDAILSHQHDRTRVITGNEWLAGQHPRASTSHGSSHTGNYHLDRTRLSGTIFHIGISPAEIPRLPAPWFASDEESQQAVRLAVLKNLALLPPAESLHSRVIDIRRNDPLLNIGDRVLKTSQSDSSTVIRLSRVADKNLINAMLDSWVKGASAGSSERCALYLCDLGRYQALDARWIIDSFFRNRPIPWTTPKRSAIFLVTEDLCCLRLDLEVSTNSTSALSQRVAVTAAAENSESLGPRLLAVLRELRLCDSDLLWKRIATLEQTQAVPVLIHDVLWERGAGSEVLPNYLDFSVLAQDQEAARYIRRSLRRLLALFPTATDFALDPLIEASLHDAKKWLVRPMQEKSERVLVGSLSVSGSTINRYCDVPGTTVVGAIDCIRTPYYDPDTTRFPHVAALLWDPKLPVDSSNRAQYRRVAKSAFIEPIKHSPRLDPVEFDEDLYKSLGSDTLLKLGHWSYGDRHSLLEINSELAIEQSSASESGAIPWLSEQISKAISIGPVIIAFPVHRLAYRLAHNIETRVREKLSPPSGVTLLPLSFLPRIAGGISRIAPLAVERARSLYNNPTTDRPTIFFVDVGFITNRTLRHVVRQFRAIGFDNVRALGLLNRSSAPAFSGELDDESASVSAVPIPKSYWRWNVPTMGTGTHCTMCGALPALLRMRRAIDESHPDLIPHLELIGNRWRARDVADFWDEYGIRPLPFNNNQLEKLSAFSQPLVLLEPKPTLTSTTLSARILEYLRFTGDVGLPIRVAEALIESGSPSDHATELLTSILLLTGGTLASADRHDYVSLLVFSTFQELDSAFDSEASERRSRLLGLVALAFAIQSTRCKLEVLNRLVSHLSRFEIRDPTLRIALMALTTDSDESTRVQDAFSKACSEAPVGSALRRNYLALRPIKATARQTWANLTQAFGRSESHAQHSILGHLLANVRTPKLAKAKLIKYIEQLSSLLGQCDARFIFDGFSVDLRALMQSTRDLERSATGAGTVDLHFETLIMSTFRDITHNLHRCLPRYGDRSKSPLVYMLFKDRLRDCAAIHSLQFGIDVVMTIDARLETWPTDYGDYFPLCGHVDHLLNEVFSNISTRSIFGAPPDHPKYRSLDEHARCWVSFDTTSESLRKGMRIIFVNGINSDQSWRDYEVRTPHLSEFGVEASSKKFDSAGRSYYQIEIRLPSLSSVLELA